MPPPIPVDLHPFWSCWRFSMVENGGRPISPATERWDWKRRHHLISWPQFCIRQQFEVFIHLWEWKYYSTFSLRLNFTIGVQKFGGFSEITISKRFVKQTPKRHLLTRDCVVWAIKQDNWWSDLWISRSKKMKEVTRTVGLTYVPSDP